MVRRIPRPALILLLFGITRVRWVFVVWLAEVRSTMAARVRRRNSSDGRLQGFL